MEVFLETERMVLRRFVMDDVEALLALDGDPRVRMFVEDGSPVSRATAAAMIDHCLGFYRRSEVFGFWAAIEAETGRFIGWFHLRPGENSRADEPELGYRLISAVWGRGFATEGSVALIDRAFESPHVTRVVAETMVVHTASRRVMEKAGMKLVRRFHTDWPVRIAGDEHGDVEYAITRLQWLADRA